MNQIFTIKKYPTPGRITVMRDAQLIAHALKHADADRRDFILRLRRSFHQHGSLTPAMREALARRQPK